MDKYVFADEAGNFDFSLANGATRYFVLCTVSADSCDADDDLLHMRRELGWRGLHLEQKAFHATEDPQAVRDEVFALLQDAEFRIDATILEKRKAQPHLQTERGLYKMAWYLHFKHVARLVATRDDRLMVVAASLGTKKKRSAFHNAVDSVRNDGLIRYHCDGLIRYHLVRLAADDLALIERGSEAAGLWGQEWSCLSRSGVTKTGRICRSGRWQRGIGLDAGRCAKRWPRRSRRCASVQRAGQRRSWGRIAG